MRWPLSLAGAGAVCLVIGAPALAAQEPAVVPPSVLSAFRLAGTDSIRIDGSLDEQPWRTAAPARDFRQREPDNGAPATERTEVRVLYDAGRLIIGAALYDSEPGGVLGNQMQRDQSFSADDRFIVTLDTFLDGRSGYLFQTNPLGALYDGLISASSNSGDDSHQDVGAAVNRSWDGIWTVKARRTPEGWTVEMELPVRTLNFDPAAASWGVNFQRTIRRKAEESVWTGYLRNEGVANMSNAGHLQGLTGLSQGIGLDIKPFAVGAIDSAPGRADPRRIATGDLGADVFYNLTPALRANVSVNTDFAETEVDERQVNLTRFPLFFEEKREFFLQGANYFDFAREIGNQVTPFFSRRIGLDDEGIPQAIDVGAKLTGQIGRFDVGVLHVRTGDTASTAGANFTVSRMRRRIGRESYAGLLYTRRDARATALPVLQTVGVDSALRTSRFLGRKTVEWSNWFLVTTNPLHSGGNVGRGSRLAFPNDPFYFDFSYRELQENYAPAVGFVQRNGFRRYNPEVGYTWRFGNHSIVRSVQIEVDWEFIYDMQNRRLTETNQIKPLTLVFADGSQFAYEVHPTYERLDREFELSDGVLLPAGGTYEFTRHEIGGSMSDRYPISFGGEVTLGSFYSGTNDEYQVNVSIRPRAGLSLGLEAQRNVLALAEGSFSTTVVRVIANSQFSPWLSLANNVQYDDVSNLFGWQMRLRWIQRPGNDVFFVFTQNWQEFDDVRGRDFRVLDTRAAAKVVYTRRF